MKKWHAKAGLLALIFISGCGGEKKELPVSLTAAETKEAPKAAEISVDPATAATVKGRVSFEGEAPALRDLSVGGNPECAVFHPGGKIKSEELLIRGGFVQNVFVYVKEGLEGRVFGVPPRPVVIENKNCVYVPHVVGVEVGQEVELLNGDATLHNIHSYSKSSKSWNLGLPFQGMKQLKKFSSPEIMVTLKCDVHPWMIGYVGVLPHPYFSVTAEDGRFELKNLPPGEYTVEAWHEKLGVQTQTIKLEPRETKEIEFKFSG
jgi:plastocyanin